MESGQSLPREAQATVVASVIGNFVSATPMVNSVFGLFLIPLTQEFHWTRASVSAVLGIVAVVGAVCYPVVGRLADRFGARRIALIGNVLFAAAVASLSLANASLGRFYFLFALVGITAAIPSTVLFTKVISGWFTARRGLFLGLTAGIGNGAGSTVMPIVGALLIAAYGWRGAYQGIAVLMVALGFPAAYFLLRDPPNPEAQREGAENQSGMTLREARGTATFWIILFAIALGAGCLTAMFAHVVPILLDRGMPMTQASTVLAVFALVCVAWQITVGHLLDRTRSPRIAAPFFIAALVGLILFERSTSLPALFGAAALMGIGLGTEYGVLPYYISRYFGLRSYGSIYGLMYGIVVLTMGITPFLMDAVFDSTGSYNPAIHAIGAALLIGAAAIARLRPYDALRHREVKYFDAAEQVPRVTVR